MRRKSFIYSAIILFLCVFKLYAQDTINYDIILTEALKKNLTIRNELLNIDLAKGNYFKSNNFFPKYPEIGFDYETDRFNYNQGQRLFGITLSQDIEIAGQFSLRNDISNYRIKSAEYEFKSKAYEIGYTIKSILNNIITLQLKVQLADETQKINEELLSNSERRLNAGDISELEYNLILIETNNSRANFAKIQSEYKNAVSSLNVYLDYDKGKEFYIKFDTSYKPILLSLKQLEQIALSNRTEIGAKKYEKLATVDEISLYKFENIPTLRLSVGYTNGTNIITGDDIFGQHNILYIKDIDRTIKFGIGLSVPLPFNGLFNYNKGNIRVAEVKTMILNNEIELLSKRIRSEVIIAFNKWESSKKNIELLQNTNIIIENALELLKNGYVKGEISLINYLLEKQKLFEMRLHYIETFSDYNQSLIELERVTQTKFK